VLATLKGWELAHELAHALVLGLDQSKVSGLAKESDCELAQVSVCVSVLVLVAK
jgi:hypothetical protein